MAYSYAVIIANVITQDISSSGVKERVEERKRDNERNTMVAMLFQFRNRL